MPSFFSTGGLSSRRVQRQIDARRRLGRVASGAGEILSKAARFAGFAFGSVLNFFNLEISDLWGILVEGYFTLKTFDWNATDRELEAQIESNNKAIATAAANAIGNYLGWGAVRLVNFFAGRLFTSRSQQAAQGIKVPVLSARIGLALAEEGNDELRSNVQHFLGTATSALIGNAFLKLTLAARRNELFGQKSITEPQTDGSIAAKVDEQIERLPEFWQQPAEALIEGFEDAIVEAGYVISYQIDDHIEALRFHDRNPDSTPERAIEVQVHEESEEKLLVQGSERDVKQALTIIRPAHQLLENRDVGQILGIPADENITLKPQLRHLNIRFLSNKKPPFFARGKESREAIISVPDVRPNISWREFKNTIPSFVRGKIFVQCKLKNGRSMKVWASSFASGKSLLIKLATLSAESIAPDSFRKSEGESMKIKKETVYPAFATILYQGKSETAPKHSKRFSLWQDEPPSDFVPIK